MKNFFYSFSCSVQFILFLVSYNSTLNARTFDLTDKTEQSISQSNSIFKNISQINETNDSINGADDEIGISYHAKIVSILGEGREGKIFEVQLNYKKLDGTGEDEEDKDQVIDLVIKKIKKGFALLTKAVLPIETEFIFEHISDMESFAPKYYYADAENGLIIMQKISLLDIRESQYREENKFLKVARDLITSMNNLHHMGYTHNDLKADNVGFDGEHWKLIDFGTAKVSTESIITKPSIAYDKQISRYVKYRFGATIRPEVNERTDIRALGILLLELKYGISVLEYFEQNGFLQKKYADRLTGIRENTATKSVRVKNGPFMLQKFASALTFKSSPFKKALRKTIAQLSESSDKKDQLIAAMLSGDNNYMEFCDIN